MIRKADTPSVRYAYVDLAELPRRLGTWTFDRETACDTLPPDGSSERVTRAFVNKDAKKRAAVYVATWLDPIDQRPHRPELCYRGFGGESTADEDLRIETDDGSQFTARLLTIDRQGQPVHLLYWYQRGDRVFGDSVRDYWRRRTAWSLQSHRTIPPIVKVMIQSPVPDAGGSLDELEALAADVFTWSRNI
jgi:hypothetical protein